ncbi:PiggyBac transposable element-derived protein 2 [Eumeta japonica]|uniref:PiggyBac transposable element-derived protein 2 n=1 Tax=Eumeta variegata TaxID=151549 RepID=A0A4C1Z7D1_EUMVA|nr:PiggyBac transposable element-derived protein 2 [Eumeta japonica]
MNTCRSIGAALPEDNEEENLSDDDEYVLLSPPRTIEESDTETESNDEDESNERVIEVIYVEEAKLDKTEETNDIKDLSTSISGKNQNQKIIRASKRDKLKWTEKSIDYERKHKTDLSENCPDLGVSGNVVTRLVDTVRKNLNYKLFMDDWYTSLPLMVHLHTVGILPLGTIQINRAKEIDLPSVKQFMKHDRGYCIEKCTEVNDVELSVTTWVDNKIANLCSSHVGKDPMDTVKRYSKEKKSKIDVLPSKAIAVYNKYIGAVDLLDSMLRFYRIKIK